MEQNNKTKTIRVSSDTVKMLGKERNGFETPDECLQRILNKHCGQKEEPNNEDDEE